MNSALLRLATATLYPLCLVLPAAAWGAAPLSGAPTPAPAAAPMVLKLDRLFFAPETRAALDRQRSSNRQSVQSLQGGSLTLNGTLIRSNGKRTYWINGHQQEGNALPPGVAATTQRNAPAQTTFQVSGEPATTLRVGESAAVGSSTGEPIVAGKTSVRKAR